MHPDEFKQYLAAELYEKFMMKKENIEVLLDQKNRKFCPYPNCDTIINVNDSLKNNILECPKCKR